MTIEKRKRNMVGENKFIVFVILLSQSCHWDGTIMPRRWHGDAIAVAQQCHADGTSVPQPWHKSGTIDYCKTTLYITDADALLQGSDLVFLGGDELLPDKTFIACLHKSLDDSRIVKLLRLVDLGTARTTSGMDMGEVLAIFPDILDDIPLHLSLIHI